MKKLIGMLLVCGSLSASVIQAAEPVTHVNPDRQAAQKKARKAFKKDAKARKAARRKPRAKKVAK